MTKVNTSSAADVLAYARGLMSSTPWKNDLFTVTLYGTGIEDPTYPYQPYPSVPDDWHWWYRPLQPGTVTTVTTVPEVQQEEDEGPLMKSYDDMDNLRLEVLEWLGGIGEYPEDLKFIIGEDLAQDLYDEQEREKVLERAVVKTLSWVLGRIKGGTNDSGQSKVE